MPSLPKITAKAHDYITLNNNLNQIDESFGKDDDMVIINEMESSGQEIECNKPFVQLMNINEKKKNVIQQIINARNKQVVKPNFETDKNLDEPDLVLINDRMVYIPTSLDKLGLDFLVNPHRHLTYTFKEYPYAYTNVMQALCYKISYQEEDHLELLSDGLTFATEFEIHLFNCKNGNLNTCPKSNGDFVINGRDLKYIIQIMVISSQKQEVIL